MPTLKTLAMTLLRKSVASTVIAVTLAFTAAPRFLPAQTSPAYGPNAKACQLMPTSDLEASYGGKVTDPHGFDGESSNCTVNIGGLAVKLQSAPPGAGGVPTSIPQGLMGARMMLGDAKQSPETNTKDFGKVGCLSMKMTKGFDGKPLTKPLLIASCFLLEGGYLNMSVSSENPRQVNFDLIRPLLEKAAAKR